MAKSRIRKFRESFLYAGRGLRLCITGERNFRVHMTAAFYVTAAAVMGHVTSTEAAVLCLCFGLTMGAELINICFFMSSKSFFIVGRTSFSC